MEKNRSVSSVMLSILKVIAISLAIVLICLMPVFAWFTYQRSVIAATKVSNPLALYINAANIEQIKYLDLSEIDVEEDPNVHYKDFVFSVNGKNIDYFKLQLAHTTNNQFTYTIYPATKVASAIEVESNPISNIIYITHDGSNEIQHYYVPSGTDAVAGAYLNDKVENSETLGDGTVQHDDKTFHKLTYDNYGNVNKYAEPMYWQSSGQIATIRVGESTNFVNYYILRVGWGQDAQNTKETDILYIAAKKV